MPHSPFLFLLLLPLLNLAACSADYSPNTYAAAAAQQANKVERGVIVGRRQVEVTAQGTIGAVTGGAAGGIAGSQAPGGPISSAFGALGGTLVGGLVGTATEHATGDTKAWEYIVRQPNGDLLSVTQTNPQPLAIGLNVLVITGKQARVVPDYTVPVSASATPALTVEKPPVEHAPAATPPPAEPAPIAATPLPAPITLAPAPRAPTTSAAAPGVPSPQSVAPGPGLPALP
ncbi:MAG TPA: hypothetical protein VLI93_16670 [Acetobacteraceae bacterium]|nr:hypothetical protein [Acetobacteraceae bacterium]